MKKILLLMIALILLVPTVSAVFTDSTYDINNNQHSVETNYSFFVSAGTPILNYCFIQFDDNITQTNTTYTMLSGTSGYCENISELLYPVGTNLTMRFYVNDTNGLHLFNQTSFIVEVREQGLDIRECPQTTALAIVLMTLSFLAVFLLFLGITSKVYVIAVFSGFLIIIMGWYISPCQAWYGMLMSVLGGIIFLWYAIKGLGFSD